MPTPSAAIEWTAAEREHIDECYPFIVRLMREVGPIVRAGFTECSTQVVTTKTGTWDLVTQFDRQVEQQLMAGITAVYAHHRFVAEETAAENGLTDAPTWIIDPIDGTCNFVHGIPIVGISVALAVRRETVIGVVYNPVTDEMYRCRLGAGAFLNDKPIRCSSVRTLDDAIYAHEVSFARVERVREKNIKRIHKFAAVAQG